MLSLYGWILVACLIIGGVIGLIDLIRKKNEDIAEKIESFQGYFGYVGAFLLGMGIFNLVYIGSILSGLGTTPVFTIVLVVALGTAVLLGLLLGAGIFTQISAVAEVTKRITEKLIPVKVPVSIVAICTGSYILIAALLGLNF